MGCCPLVKENMCEERSLLVLLDNCHSLQPRNRCGAGLWWDLLWHQRKPALSSAGQCLHGSVCPALGRGSFRSHRLGSNSDGLRLIIASIRSRYGLSSQIGDVERSGLQSISPMS